MNNSRRRKHEKKTEADEIRALKTEITTQAIEIAYHMVLSLGLYTLRKHNGFGKKRLQEFKDNLDNTIIAHNKGNLTRKEILKELRSQDMDVNF